MKKSAAAVAAALAWSAAMAQEAPVAPMQKVIITGSNIKRADSEGTAPVAVITAQDIKDSGAATVADLLRNVPGMGANNNTDFGSGSGFAKGVATAALRGLGSTSTLVLLNGRRMTPSAYADPNNGNSTLYDLNSIPVNAIERVEILLDGASAVYGSDAIGGVVNFILKTNYNGAQISANAGANDDREFKKQGVNAIWGKGDLEADGYSFMITGDVSKRDRTARRDVKDIEYQQYVDLNGRFRSNYSSSVSQYPIYFKETAPGSKNFGVSQATGPTNMLFNLGCPASEQITGGTKDGLLSSSTLIGRTFCNYDADQFAEGQGAGKDYSVLSHGEFKLGKNVTAFADAAYTRSIRDYTGAPITLGTTSVTNFMAGGVATPFQAILPVGHPDNPFPNARSSVNYRFTSLRGGSRTVNDGVRLLAGLKGSVGGWEWESAALWNRSSRDETSYGRLYLPTLRKLLTGTSLAQLNADPTIGHDVFTENSADIAQWDAKATTEFGQLAGGKMGLALGGEVRRETTKLNPDPLVGSGDIYGLANTIIDTSRTVKSGFAELRVPLLKSFEMDAAGRWDKYPSLKTNFVPKVGAKWTVSDMLTLRGTYAEGFRAPAVVQVAPGGAQFFLSNIWDPKRCENDLSTPKPNATAADCRASASGTGGYNPDLKPETSKSYTFGLIFSPISNFDFLTSVYKIRREGEIALAPASTALKFEDQNPGNVVRDTNPVNFVKDANGNPIPGTGPLLTIKEPWVNQGATEVRGVDFEFKLRNNLGAWGSLSSSVKGNYLASYKIAQNPGDIENNVAGGRAGIMDWALSSGLDNPRWRSTFSTTWKKGDNAVNVTVNYVGAVSLLRVMDGKTTYPQPFCYYGTKKSTDAAPDRNTSIPLYETYYPECAVKEWTTVGVSYTYTGFDKWTLNVNIQNLLDTKAPYDPNQSAAGFNSGLHNPYGRYFRLGASYTF
jgi:iron complex outermembrane receptor protein